jgi:hypothetical protein
VFARSVVPRDGTFSADGNEERLIAGVSDVGRRGKGEGVGLMRQAVMCLFFSRVLNVGDRYRCVSIAECFPG